VAKKESRIPEPYQDVKDPDREKTENTEKEVSEPKKEVSDPGIQFAEPGLRMSVAEKMIGDVLLEALMKVDPEIRKDNPVWHWSIADDHCTFIFRNGQKVRI